jgi:hypothetical protein
MGMMMLQKISTYFRKPAPAPVALIHAVDLDERINGTRSKRARIRETLRRYEQGRLKESQAVEELLKILR